MREVEALAKTVAFPPSEQPMFPFPTATAVAEEESVVLGMIQTGLGAQAFVYLVKLVLLGVIWELWPTFLIGEVVV